MKKALILHGMPTKDEYLSLKSDSPSNSHWLPWVQKQLLINGYMAQTPEFPEPYNPQYDKWVRVFEQYELDKETLLIGHSCGAGFLVRYLSENKINIGKLILVAPWVDPEEKELNTGFFNFKIDELLTDRISELVVIISKDDEDVIIKSSEIIMSKLPKHTLLAFKDKGHFCLSDLKTAEFPELLEAIL